MGRLSVLGLVLLLTIVGAFTWLLWPQRISDPVDVPAEPDSAADTAISIMQLAMETGVVYDGGNGYYRGFAPTYDGFGAGWTANDFGQLFLPTPLYSTDIPTGLEYGPYSYEEEPAVEYQFMDGVTVEPPLEFEYLPPADELP
jgi:hypothetical protein